MLDPSESNMRWIFEAAVSTLEAKLNEERICENVVSHVIEVIRSFYDADCVLVVAINPQSLTLRCVNKVYREGFVSSIMEALLVPGFPEMLQEMMQVKTFTVQDIRTLARSRPKVYRDLALVGLDLMAVSVLRHAEQRPSVSV